MPELPNQSRLTDMFDTRFLIAWRMLFSSFGRPLGELALKRFEEELMGESPVQEGEESLS